MAATNKKRNKLDTPIEIIGSPREYAARRNKISVTAKINEPKKKNLPKKTFFLFIGEDHKTHAPLPSSEIEGKMN